MTRTIYQETQVATASWTFVQWAVLVICTVNIVWSAAGFAAEPSFAVGHHAPTQKVLAMDFNGWHAISGIAMFAPGLFLCRRTSWSVLYLFGASLAAVVPGIWALFSPRVLWVLHMPDHVTDAVIHFAIAAVMIAVALVQIRRDGGWAATMADLRAQPR
ncbi:uncharacterized protein DUF4383 [Nocardioides albertanoniae]|uniref:Uncharacterized protein DUF4383 n=1 Tax=Nocardioides albertanoniae TaxID=1175486 RepID=A0A543A492_9ACTN|nr:DUF4383 domain-containing protein [Nocardioides albertanoniae]TQL67411.1 uncharacterized protein DUF4383 [Nocardioides albertanoniae]